MNQIVLGIRNEYPVVFDVYGDVERTDGIGQA